jgi:hypothetical protein
MCRLNHFRPDLLQQDGYTFEALPASGGLGDAEKQNVAAVHDEEEGNAVGEELNSVAQKKGTKALYSSQ